ncbi:MAG: RNA-binding transcriptional accessory protein [Candidatus Aminicenantes bacterium]|nr:RNA-binding transcriptional accessory protein [Candidatus Aminicenantes bacterium]
MTRKRSRFVEIAERIAAEFKLGVAQVARTLALMNEGSTIPFIARYRKEQTGNLNEVRLRELDRRRKYFQELEERRASILNILREQGNLTPELGTAIEGTADKHELEDLYQPFKPKRMTRASKAREAGLEPLARRLDGLEDPAADLAAEAAKFIDPEKGIETAEAALQGAGDILAEEWAENAEARKAYRELARTEGVLVASARKEFEGQSSKYEMYYHFRESVGRLPSHRVLAMIRGEREKVLKIELAVPKKPALRDLVVRFVRHPKSAAAPRLVDIALDALDRLLAPTIETEIRSEIREKAEAEAFKVFGDNLRDLLLAAPAGPKPVLGIDPGFRTGCKVAAVDGTGKFLEYRTIFPNAPKNDTDGAKLALLEMIDEHKIGLIAVGNGTAGRETETFVRACLDELSAAKRPVCVVVNESGASVYSASDAAVKEFPRMDVTIRGAISIARRLQDPLSELVKIEPKSIGVGQYQHDVDQASLRKSLDDVVESCVNSVGVDLNLASEELLKYVSGLNRATASAIVARRHENGPFASREDLKAVKGFGEKTFEQAAGFLRIPGASNPLDNSAVHPERYAFVEEMAGKLGTTVPQMIGNEELLKSVDPRKFSGPGLGLPTIRDILKELEKPGRDPRSEFRYAVFSENARTVDDLAPDQVLEGVVSNIVDFGAFVDIGVHQDGLVHISEMGDKFVSDPHKLVKVGQLVRVRILSVDKERKRIGLSMKKTS